MTKSPEETVQVPVSVLQQLQSRLEALERDAKIRAELAINPNAKIIDPAYEAWKLDVARPAKDRTQDIANKRFGTTGPRFLVRLDSTGENGKPGPKIDEHPQLEISAHSEHEARAFYTDVCGIRKHDYRLIVTQISQQQSA